MPTGIVEQAHAGYGTHHDPFLTPLQKQAVAGYRRLEAEALRRGFSAASVISMLPFGFPVTGPVHQVDIRIPGVPLDADVWLASPKLKLSSGLEVPYVQHVFPQWKPLQQKYIMGQIDFEEVNDSGHIWPIEQAEDAVKQNSLGADRGGVFCYDGIDLPGRAHKLKPEEQQLADNAHLTLMNYCTGYHEKISDAYMSRGTTKSWQNEVGKGKYHRWIALYLFRIGAIRALPAWYEEIAQTGGKHQPKCDQCQQNVEPGAVLCRHCNRVLNPFEAFAKLMIDADTPGAKLAAKRLSDQELTVLMESGRLDQMWLEAAGIIVVKDKKGKKD